jgi:arabinose-5-phosphate isomerase
MLMATSALPFPTGDQSEAVLRFRAILSAERAALDAFLARPDADIDAIVDLIATESRPIICTGIGKSGLVSAKMAATFSSLGTPAFFLNAADAAHGDLGAVQADNVVILLSNSGTTAELMRILPLLQARNCRLVGLIGQPDSPLARAVDYCIEVNVDREADPAGMAPTSSTTLQMAVGDALAVAVSQAKGFSRADFLRHHPAGLLGRQMIPIRELMRRGVEMPTVLPQANAAELLAVIGAGRLGAACVVDWRGQLLGMITDGDIRRLIQARRDLYLVRADEIMQTDIRSIGVDATVGETIDYLHEQSHPIFVLPVVASDGVLAGIIHSYDLMQGQP